MISWLLFQQIVVLFLMIAMGWIIVKAGFLKAGDSKVLSVVCLYLVVPCMQIQAFQVEYSDSIRNGFFLALTAALLIHGILFATVYGTNRIFHFSDVEKGSILYSNAGNLIVPLVTAILGEDWVIYASAFMFVQALILWSHGKLLMQGTSGKIEWKKILLNVNILATLLGASLFFAHIQIGGILSDTIKGVSKMIGPISMFAIGMTLADVKWKEVFRNKRIYLVALLKMIVIPVICLFVLKFTPLYTLIDNGKMILLVSLLAVFAPSGATIPQMALVYNRDADYASSINVFTTLICIATMPLLTYFYML